MARELNVFPICSLPYELLILIVIKLKLPLQKIFQLRLVCKIWNILLQDHNCLKQLFLSLGRSPVLMYSFRHKDVRVFTAYSIHIRDWHAWIPSLESKYFSRYQVYGEAGDLLLVEDGSVEDEKAGMCLQLVNPAMKWQRKLPSLPTTDNWDPLAIGMSIDASSKSYNVFIVNREDADHWYASDESWTWLYKTYVYTCNLNYWKVIGPWRDKELEDITDMTFYEGSLHCFVIEMDDNSRDISKKVCRFDEQTFRWKELSAQPPAILYFECLFESQGHLMLVGGERNQFRLQGVHIWQLEKEKNIWVKSITMPDDILDHLYSFDPEYEDELSRLEFSCTPTIQYIRIVSSSLVRHPTECRFKRRYVICDLSTSFWWVVPKVDYDQLLNTQLIMPQFGFETP